MIDRHHLQDLRVDGRWDNHVFFLPVVPFVSDKTYFGRIFFTGEIVLHSSHRSCPITTVVVIAAAPAVTVAVAAVAM